MDDISVDNLFDRRVSFPESGAMRRFTALIGIEDAKTRLVRSLGVLINPTGLACVGEESS